MARLIAEGSSNVEIAGALSISRHTARHHTERLMQRLGIHSRSRIVSVLLQRATVAESGTESQRHCPPSTPPWP